MRSGVLGLILAWSVGAGLAWGQIPPDQRFPQGPPVIPPQIPNYQNYGPMPDAQGNPMYPPPANWDAFDLAGPAGGAEGSTPRFWLSAEYLMWFPKSARYNAPLLTSSAPVNQGIIGNSSTIILNGLDSINFGLTSGFRVGGGLWFDADGRYGWDASGFGTESKTDDFAIQTTGNAAPVIARPFTNDQTGGQGSYLIAAPRFAVGYASDKTSTNAWGFDTHFLMNLYRSAGQDGVGYSLTALAGARFFALSDKTELLSSTLLYPGNTVFFNGQSVTAASEVPTTQFRARNFFLGTRTTTGTSSVALNVLDQFKARNDFYGGDLGLYQQFNMGRWSIGVATKVAIGGIHQTVDVLGLSNLQYQRSETVVTNVVNRFGTQVFNQTTSTLNTDNNVVGGGIYAQANNIGRYERNQFAVIPEANFRVGYSFTPAITGFVSYNVLYVNRVVRAPDLITGFVNPAMQPTSSQYGDPSLPRAFNPFPTTDYWLQGVTFGLNIRF